MAALLEPGRTINLILYLGMKGAGDVVFPTVVGITFMWLVGVGVSFFLGVGMGIGLPAIWIAMALDEWIRGFIAIGRWKSGKWKTKVRAEMVES